MVVPFLQNSTFTGLVSTQNYATSQEWHSTYTIVQSNSAEWSAGGNIIPTVTNYLSTYNVVISSANIAGELTITGNLSSFGDVAYIKNSRIIGNDAEVIGTGSVAFNNSIAEGNYSHAIGVACVASGEGSHAQGNATNATGEYSHAEGEDTLASSPGAHAEGRGTQASGQASHAEGEDSKAIGDHSHAEGFQTEASNTGSHAEGSGSVASGEYSHAEGATTQAQGQSSHAEGDGTIASGIASHAEGQNSQAIGDYSHAEGNNTQATGSECHAEGSSTIASSLGSHAEGGETRASGVFSHAEGSDTIAQGTASHAEGVYSKAIGSYSHAEGYYSIAKGSQSHAAGYFSEASFNRSWIWKGDTSSVYLSTTKEDQFMVRAAGGLALYDYVGIGTDSSDNALTVVGSISASNTIYALDGNSNLWNTASGAALNASTIYTQNYTNTNFLPLTGGIISGETRINNNLTVFGNLTASGTSTFFNTIFSTTSALSVVHVGTGPAIWVGNNGNGNIASFYDIDQNIEILHVGGINSTNPNVGVKTSTPNKDFTVNGELSASGAIYTNIITPNNVLTINGGVQEGLSTTASGTASHAEGSATTASGFYSHAEGNQTKALNDQTHAEGFNTQASGRTSHAEGSNTIASGPNSHAEGSSTIASGHASHSEGFLTVAAGSACHAEGFAATAGHDWTYIWSDGNLGTITQNISTTRTGQYMVSASGGVFIPGNVGIGTDSVNNALTVVGNISASNLFYGKGFELNDNFTSANTQCILQNWSSTSVGNAFKFFKSRSGTIGQLSAVQSGDILGEFSFSGVNSSNSFSPSEGASIRVRADGASGTAIPASITFSTGTSTIFSNIARMTIKSSGNIGINTTEPNQRLTVSGNLSATGVVYASGGDSNQWNNIITTYQSASSTFAPKVVTRSYSQFSSGDYAVQQGRNVELSFSAPANNTNVTITLPRQDTNDNAQSDDELLIRLSQVSGGSSTVTIRRYQYTGSLPYLLTYENIVTFGAMTPAQTIRLRLTDRVWSLVSTPNLFSPSPIGNITPSTGTFTTLSATGVTTASAINLQTVALSSVIFTGETKTSTTSVTASDVYVKVIVNGQNKYLRLFDVI
jgi:hypothetical protein